MLRIKSEDSLGLKMRTVRGLCSLSVFAWFSGFALCGGSDVCRNERIPYQAGKLISLINVTAEEVSNVPGFCCKQVTFLEAKNVSIRVPTLSLNTVSVQTFQNYNYGIKSSIVQDIISLQEGTCPDRCDTHFLSIHPLHEGDDLFIRSSSMCLVFINLERMGMNFLYSKGTKASIVAVVDPEPCNNNVNEKNNEKIACSPTRQFTPTTSKQRSDLLSTPPVMPSIKFIQTSSVSVSWTNSNKNEDTMATESPKETYTATRDVRENEVQHLDSTEFLTKAEAQGLLSGLYATTVFIIIILICVLVFLIHLQRRKSVTDVVPAQQSVIVTRSNSAGTNLLHENWSKCNLLHQSSQMSPSAELVLSSQQLTFETTSTNSTNWSMASQDDDEERTIYHNPDNLTTNHHSGHSFNPDKSSLQAEWIQEFYTQSCCDAHENKEHTEYSGTYIPSQTDGHNLVNCVVQTVIEGSSTSTMDTMSDDDYSNMFSSGLTYPPKLNNGLANIVNSENMIENASGVVDTTFIKREDNPHALNTTSEI